MAAALAASALGGCHRHEATPMETLLALAPRASRVTEGRLSGFEWSPRPVERRGSGALDAPRLELSGAAAAVVEANDEKETAPAMHEAGVAYLVIGRYADAVDRLEGATRLAPNDARAWNDLAVARYELAVHENRGDELPDALAAAEQARRLAPQALDARFNRALIVEELGVAEAARRAWQQYLQSDRDSRWADDAARHLAQTPLAVGDAEFRAALPKARAAAEHGDTAALHRLVTTYPQYARTWASGPILAEWADAVRRGDTQSGETTLTFIRSVGRALAAVNGVRLLSDAVAQIDAADAPKRARLADAIAIYRDARILFSKRQPSAARPLFSRAAELFKAEASVLESVSRCYEASCADNLNEFDYAAKQLRILRLRVDDVALGAEIDWERCLAELRIGHLGESIAAGTSAVEAFGRIRENRNRAEVGVILAGVLDGASQPRAAWNIRRAAYKVLSRAGLSERVHANMTFAAGFEAARGHRDAAVALADLTTDALRRDEAAPTRAVAEASSAEFHGVRGDAAEARAAVQRAREAASHIADPTAAVTSAQYVDIAEAVVLRTSDPRRSIALLDGVIDEMVSDGLSNNLPKAYLERGRTKAGSGDVDGALLDFRAGIRELEAQRSSINATGLRGSFFDTRARLFSEAIALLLHRGSVDAAFAISDGARARTLHEQLTDVAPDSTISLSRMALGSGNVFIEYAVVPDGLAIFYASAAGNGAMVVRIAPDALQASADRYASLLQHRGPLSSVLEQSSSLYDVLIRPLAQVLRGATRIAVVPDQALHEVAFAALFDRRSKRYLIEQFALSTAPSAAFAVSAPPRRFTSAVIVGDPRSDAPNLASAAREATTIASLYDLPTLLLGEHATRAAFVSSITSADVIHYAGHAADTLADDAILRLAGASGDAGNLDAPSISHLTLQKHPLVVLAACSTLRGDYHHVEGMPSVARAFLAAGARSVIATLWDVDDDVAAQLFTRFHQHLKQSASPTAALRAAQIDMATDRDPRLRDPASWAPVELLGSAE